MDSKADRGATGGMSQPRLVPTRDLEHEAAEVVAWIARYWIQTR
jgi:hypothetical protein